MPVRGRSLALPEFFHGLLSIGVALVLTAKIVAGTIHDARRIRDTISVAGSARKPIDDTNSREKDVNAVVTATFAVKR